VTSAQILLGNDIYVVFVGHYVRGGSLLWSWYVAVVLNRVSSAFILLQEGKLKEIQLLSSSHLSYFD
jgi:hypothetical protein